MTGIQLKRFHLFLTFFRLIAREAQEPGLVISTSSNHNHNHYSIKLIMPIIMRRFIGMIICVLWAGRGSPLFLNAFETKATNSMNGSHKLRRKVANNYNHRSLSFGSSRTFSGRGAAIISYSSSDRGPSRKSNLLLHASAASSSDDGGADGVGSSGNGRRREFCRNSVRGIAGKTRSLIQKILKWQRATKRSVFTAAALTLSVLFCSQQHLDQHCHVPTTMDGNNQNEIRIVRNYHQHDETTVAATATATATTAQSTYTITTSTMPRGGSSSSSSMARNPIKEVEESVVTASRSTGRTLQEGLEDLSQYMKGPKSDTLLLLLATALITPLCKRFGTSPILGFLASGMLLGPNGCGYISGIHTTETLAELGIVFFLFEMGIELSVERLMSMKRDVFGLGFSQFMVTAMAIAGVGKVMGLPANALVVMGGGLALSSSAFVLQLLKDKEQLATRFGRAAFGILLFQDLAVVPLLVVTPILAGGGGGLAKAVGSAIVKAGMALGSIAFLGRYVLNPLFKNVAQANSQEAFLGVILLTVLSMSFMTEGLGLSNTLGAFLAGVLLSETKYRYQIEADIAPFRGILLGLFFVTVGFEIDVNLIASNLPFIGSIVVGILLIKAIIATALSLAFGLSLSTSQQTGLILSQGGEFAFVTFGLARSLGILDSQLTKVMLTSVSLTMALTPLLSNVGGRIAKTLEEKSDFTHYLGQDRDASEIAESDDFVVVVGYGVVGKVVTQLLDRKFIKYVGLEIDPNKAIQARNSGLPVFYGDIGRQEVADAFNVGKAKAVIVCIADKALVNRAVIALRRWYPNLKIFCRASDADHANRLQKTLDVAAMVPILPEDNLLLTLPFGGAVLKSLGCPAEEVNAILESQRKEVLSGRGLDQNEEKMALAQLGIDADEVLNLKSKKSEEGSVTDSDRDQDDDKEAGNAVAELMVEKKEKSPFVAQVIEECCPDMGSAGSKEEEEGADPVAIVVEEEDDKDPANIVVVDVDSSDVAEESIKLSNTTEENTTPSTA